MTKEEIRDKVEDLYIKDTERFAFLMPNQLDPIYVEWLELQVYSKLHQPTVISTVCSCVRKHRPYEHNLNECRICEKPIWQTDL